MSEKRTKLLNNRMAELNSIEEKLNYLNNLRKEVASKPKIKPNLDPNAPNLDEDTRKRRRALANLQTMTNEELLKLAVKAGIYTSDGKLTSYYNSNDSEDADKEYLFLEELKANASMLIDMARSKNHCEAWYATRFELLRDLCEEHGLLTEYCNIAANGAKNIFDPPTYQQQLYLLKFQKEKLTKENKLYRQLLQEAADELSSQHDPEDSLKIIKKIESALESFEIKEAEPEK